jgi:hypothetical protein
MLPTDLARAAIANVTDTRKFRCLFMATCLSLTLLFNSQEHRHAPLAARD